MDFTADREHHRIFRPDLLFPVQSRVRDSHMPQIVRSRSVSPASADTNVTALDLPTLHDEIAGEVTHADRPLEDLTPGLYHSSSSQAWHDRRPPHRVDPRYGYGIDSGEQ